MDNSVKYTKTARLAEQLKAELASQMLPAHTPVCSVRELAVKYDISVMTADKILDRLADEDFLYRKPYSGTFIKHSPVRPPKIGYAGYLPLPDKNDPIQHTAARRLHDFFDTEKIQPQIILYHELTDSKRAELILDKLDGLLISYSHIDDRTLKVLRKFKKPVVIIGNQFIENIFQCSQVIPEFTAPLMELTEKLDLQSYDQITIVTAEHSNAEGTAEAIRKALNWLSVPQEKINTRQVQIPQGDNGRFPASQFFAQTRESWQNQLVFLTSGYFAQGMHDALGDDMPDTVSFDNLAAYNGTPENGAHFTAIDRRMTDIYSDAAKLLLQLLKEHDERSHIIQIPAKLVIRKSVKSLNTGGEI